MWNQTCEHDVSAWWIHYWKTCLTGAEEAGTQKTLSRRGFSSENCSLSIHNENRSSALIRVMIKQRHWVWPGLGIVPKATPRTRTNIPDNNNIIITSSVCIRLLLAGFCFKMTWRIALLSWMSSALFTCTGETKNMWWWVRTMTSRRVAWLVVTVNSALHVLLCVVITFMAMLCFCTKDADCSSCSDAWSYLRGLITTALQSAPRPGHTYPRQQQLTLLSVVGL